MDAHVYYLADQRCTQCAGCGRRKTRRFGAGATCNCVYRRVWRVCLDKLRDIEAGPPHWNVHRWTRDAEYAADVQIVARRVLDGKQLIIYREFFLLDKPWREVEKRTKLGRGNFFHLVYRTEQALGKALAASPMFPPRAYFTGLYEGSGGISPAYTIFGKVTAIGRLPERKEFAIAA